MANFISILRMFLGFGVVALLFWDATKQYYWHAILLTALIIWMDGLDGYVARKLNECSPAGAVIDILSDRVVELIYWMAYAQLGWVSIWVPIIVMTRGIWVDGMRSLALQQGYTAFGESSMMQHPLAVLLVSSRFSRWTYAFSKAIVFVLLIAANSLIFSVTLTTQLKMISEVLVWVVVIFCLLRGLPVLVEGQRFLKPPANH